MPEMEQSGRGLLTDSPSLWNTGTLSSEPPSRGWWRLTLMVPPLAQPQAWHW